MRKLKINSFIIGLVLLVSCNTKEANGSRVSDLPYYKDATFTPYWNLGSNEKSSFHKVSNFSLIDQDGKEINQETFKNKVYVVNFFFTTCPGICPKMTSNLKMVQDVYKTDNEVLLLSHSVTPSVDNVEVLNHYAEVNGIISDKWFLATGDKKQIYKLGRTSYFVEDDLGEDFDENDFLHTENFVLIDQQKHIRGIYNGLNKTAVKQLIADIATLKKEAN